MGTNKSTSLYKEVICGDGSRYTLNHYTFGALSNDIDNPLFNVSVSQNTFSIDIWKGCLLDCAYCHVQGCYYDISHGKSISMKYAPVRRNSSSIAEIVDHLVNYEHFIPDHSLISICTSSTEPFFNDNTIDSTLDIMYEFVKRGLKNPFWVITKMGGISEKWKSKLLRIIQQGCRILLSICWTNNDSKIEPMRASRFNNLRWMTDCGVIINWYMRPIVREWNGSKNNLQYIMEYVSSLNLPFRNMVAGGLRWTEGIEFGLTKIHGEKLPKLIKDDNTKTLEDDLIRQIDHLHAQYLPELPLFYNSACSLHHAMGVPNILCWKDDEKKACMQCNNVNSRLVTDTVIQQVNTELQQKQLGCSILKKGEKIIVQQSGNYISDSIANKYIALRLSERCLNDH